MNKAFVFLVLFVAFFAAIQAYDEPVEPEPPVPPLEDVHPNNATMSHFLRWMKHWLPHGRMLPKIFRSIKTHDIQHRYKIWKQNVKIIFEHNQLLNETWTAGLNMFSHMTDDEFKGINWGFLPPADNVTTNTNMPPVDPLAKRQSSREWKGTNKVKAVRNQGGCGSCWAFSAAGALEGGLGVDLNPQQIIDCAGLGGCGGGDPNAATKFGNKGMKPMSQYNGGRYDARQDQCKGYGNLKCDRETTMVRSGRDSDLDQILNVGPVSVCINADGLKNYRSGIANAPCTNGCNHAILATGYGPGFYNVKNSWGEGFGERGYFKFPRGQNHCGISSYCVLPRSCNGGGGGGGGTKDGKYGKIENTDRPGGDLSTTTASSAEDCQAKCFRNRDCKVFAFDTCGSTCWFKNSVTGTNDRDCRVSGIINR